MIIRAYRFYRDLFIIIFKLKNNLHFLTESENAIPSLPCGPRARASSGQSKRDATETGSAGSVGEAMEPIHVFLMSGEAIENEYIESL